MNAERVVEKILSDAKAEGEKLKGRAKKKLADEKSQLDKELSGYGDETGRLCRKAAEDRRRHVLANARMELNKEHLAAKRRLLDEVFSTAAERLKNLDDDQYLKLMSRLMLKAVQAGDEEVIIGKNETRIDHTFIKEINRRLGTGYKGNLRLSEQRNDLDGGFILKRGRIKTNVSVEVLLAQAREELEIELAKELFST